MAKLRYTFKTDTLFKMLFVKHRDLLKHLVAALLRISLESIEEFEVRNPEIPPQIMGDILPPGHQHDRQRPAGRLGNPGR